MATEIKWTPETLSDTLWALNWLIGLAPPNKLSRKARVYADRVRTWVGQAQPAVSAAEAGTQDMHVPPFPLRHDELVDLQKQVLRAVGQHPLRLSSPLARALFPLEHLERRLRHTQLSSWLVAVGIVCLAVVNGLDLVVFNLSRGIVLAVNVGATVVVLAVWAYHHFHFVAHEWDVFAEHIAHHFHHYPPAGAA